MRALSICNPLLGEAEGSRRVPGENGWSQGPAASPGTVHSDPPQGNGQALCGCSAQLVHAEIMRDGAASAARHSASRGRRGGGPPEALLAGFPDTRCPCTHPPPRALHWKNRAQQQTHSPAYWARGGASGHALSPAAAPPPLPHPRMDRGEDHRVYRKRNEVIKVSKSLFTYFFPAVMFSHGSRA